MLDLGPLFEQIINLTITVYTGGILWLYITIQIHSL